MIEDDYDSPWAPTDDDSWGDYKHDEWKQKELDDEWDSDSE